MSSNFNTMRLFCGSAHPELGQEISQTLGVDLNKIILSRFSCGETYARIKESIRGCDTYIIQSFSQNVNDDLMELFIIMDALKRCSAATVNVILPIFPYARQDKKSAPREPISARLVSDLLNAVGLNRLITMDLHADQIQGFFSNPVDHITALPLFVDYFKAKQLEDVVIVAPDTGRAKFVKRMSDRLGAKLAIMHKTRPDHNIAEIVHVVGDVKDKTVILIDDLIDTAGSVTSGVEALRKKGCKEDIYLAASHAVFSGPAVERLKAANFKEVVVTDSCPLPPEKRWDSLKVLSTATLLAEVIKRNFEKRSISPLFD